MISDLEQNHHKEFEIVFIKEGKDTSSYTFAIAKVDPVIQHFVKNDGNKIFFASLSAQSLIAFIWCNVTLARNFDTKRVSSLSLKKSKCKGRLCLYCSENDMSKNCYNKNFAENRKCANSFASNN